MKFPKSVHAEGWAAHIDTTTSPTAPAAPAHKGSGAKISATTPLHEPAATPLHAAKSVASPMAPPVRPRIDPAPTATRPHHAATLPPHRQNQLTWMLPAAAGAIVIAGVAVWALNRSPAEPTPPPALVTGSAEAPTQVAAVTPEPPPAVDRDDTPAATPTPSTTPEPAAPAHVGLPVTTVKPAAEPRTVAQAPVPAPRPDLVVRANPRSELPAPAPTPYLQPQPATTVAAAPAAPVVESQPLTVTPGNAPINLPPTAAGPATTTPQPVPPTVTPQPATPPAATSPGAPPLAQAAPLPSPEDSGITVKVRTALAADATLSAVPISVSTDHGVVKLEGQAPDAQARERATVVAASTLGVKGVDNRLTLPPPAVVSQAPSGL